MSDSAAGVFDSQMRSGARRRMDEVLDRGKLLVPLDCAVQRAGTHVPLQADLSTP